MLESGFKFRYLLHRRYSAVEESTSLLQVQTDTSEDTMLESGVSLCLAGTGELRVATT